MHHRKQKTSKIDLVSHRFVRKIGRRFTPFVFPGLWVVVVVDQIIKKMLSCRKKKKKAILLIAQNKIAADHIRLVFNLIKNDDNIDLFVADDRLVNRQLTNSELATIIPVKLIHIFPSLIHYWDLIVFVNHPWGLGVWFAPFIKKVFINHGICTGKINNTHGEDGVYGKSRVLRPFSKPFYDKMFAASHSEKKMALSLTPELQKRIAVTGFLRADSIVKLNEKKESIRTSLGYKKDDIVVHIISTWGDTSLFQTIGEDILSKSSEMTDQYRFVFSLHPRHDEFGDVKGRKRKDILKKYESMGIQPQAKVEWDKYVVACDMAISDHSSLCLYYVLLNKPVILVHVPDAAFIGGSVFDRLQKVVPICNDPAELGKLITAAKNAVEKKEYRELRSSLVDFPGIANERYKEELYRMIGE
jgi:CDP-Glycerol:Poly(glycerophosphate) glycerophosphotransferase